MAKEKKSFTKWMREMKNSDNDFINAYNANEITLKRGRPSEDGIYKQILENYGKEMAENAKNAWKKYINDNNLLKSNEKEKVVKTKVKLSNMYTSENFDNEENDDNDDNNEIDHHYFENNDDENEDDNEINLHYLENDDSDVVPNDFYEKIFNKT